ncbi:recombinase family protein [Streptomyces sp. 4F14]|uniref:recombinase family protein n=1 Tax=Streptomyces sp. 4F14 TaxID=3394380 RepID=UPI003A890A57
MRHSTTPHRGPTGVNLERVEAVLRKLQERALTRVLANGRVPRVCLYAEERSLETVRAFAEARGWRAGHWYSDDCSQSAYADRPGWGLVRQQIRSGRADGVVMPAHFDVGRDEYAEELAWFSAHLAFVAVVEGGRR